MKAMKKFSIALERYLDRLAQARVESALRSLGRDRASFVAYSTRLGAPPRLAVTDGRRTTTVHADCTVTEHNEPGASSDLTFDASEPPRSAA